MKRFLHGLFYPSMDTVAMPVLYEDFEIVLDNPSENAKIKWKAHCLTKA